VGRLGADTSSLLSDGVTGALAYEFGWKLRILRSESVLVTGSVGLGSSSATFINLYDWVYQLLQGEDAELVRGRNSLDGSGGLHAAWGISRRFGLLGSLIASYGESFDGSGNNTWHSDFRGALSYDLTHDLGIPLGLALSAGRFENEVNTDLEADTWFWNLRIGVQNRSAFSVGIGFGTSYFDSPNQGSSLQFAQATFDMRYFY